MVKVNDRIYHVYNMGLKGVVVGIEQEQSQTYLAAGPSQQRIVAVIKLDDGKIARVQVGDLMRDD